MDFNADTFKANIQHDLEIDVYNLEQEWTKQSSLFMEYAIELSDRIRLRDKHISKLIVKILESPEKYKITKLPPSDAAINKVVDYDEQTIELNYIVSLFTYAVRAIDQKRRALESEAQLLMGGFFSEPKEKTIMNNKEIPTRPMRKKKKET